MNGGAVGTRERHERSETVPEAGSARERSACVECGGRLVKNDRRGETVCVECGLVVAEDGIDHGPEWRGSNAAERDDKARVGAPTTRMKHDKGLSTTIGWRDADAQGRTLDARKRRRLRRLRTWDRRFRTRDSKERNLKQALGEIDRMASALGLPEATRETASVIYRRALSTDLLPGRSIEGVATAAVHAAARQTGIPRTIEEVAVVSRIDRTEFMRAYRYVLRELGLEVAPVGPEQYLPRFVSELDLSDRVERRARELLRAGEGTGVLSGRSPVGLAAAAIYAGGTLVNETVTQAAIAEATDISTVTIRNRYQQLLDAASEEA